MKITLFSIIVFAAIYLMSCLTPHTFEEKAMSSKITIIRSSDEKDPIMTELLSKCSPAGRIESVSFEQEGDRIINRALDLGANVVHIYYDEFYSEKKSDGPSLHYITRFWTCKQPLETKRVKKKKAQVEDLSTF
jgi:hypothetical protein